MPRLPWWAAVALVALLARLPGGAGADEKGSLPGIEDEFKAAIRKVTPATVLCTGKTAAKGPRAGGGSSGVLVSKKGLVLSDADATAVVRIVGQGRDQKAERSDSDEVEVRVPDLKSGTFKAYTAKVVRKVRDADTCLLRIVDPPAGGFKDWLSVGSSDDLAVGDFAFAMGNSFGLSDEALPSLTAGVIAALSPLPRGHAQGRWEFVYTTAAVNPGVNGGPLVDIEGRLVGTVSTFMLPEPKNPFQFLGKVVPVQRLRALYGDLPEAAEMFPEARPVKARSAQSAALEATFAHAARVAAPHVASLLIERAAPFVVLAPVGPNAMVPLARYQGPVSALLVSEQGELVTSLYNLTNIFSLANPPDPGGALPAPLRLETGLASIKSVTACFADGRKLPARIAGVDARLGIALLKVEGFQDGGYAAPLLTAVPPERFQEGRFVVAVGNPYGEQPAEAPLVSVGLLSKLHAPLATSAWRGDWQTDAGVTDANCGGAAVDLEGRVYGMLRVWAPLTHGRSSGIGFVLPWARIQEALPSLRAGRVWRRGLVGIGWKRDVDVPTVDEVTPGSPGESAGLKPGDRIRSIDGEAVATVADARRLLRFRWEEERVRLTIERPGPKKPQEMTLEVTLGGRPEPAPEPTPEPQKPADPR